jgi:heme/copper-type cytochrome/quinol oxidase subunit 2
LPDRDNSAQKCDWYSIQILIFLQPKTKFHLSSNQFNQLKPNLMENQPQASVMSVKDWMITLLITFIPVIGIIMLFVWAFSSGENPNKSNWAKATLIWFAILIVIYTFIIVVFGAVFMAMMNR